MENSLFRWFCLHRIKRIIMADIPIEQVSTIFFFFCVLVFLSSTSGLSLSPYHSTLGQQAFLPLYVNRKAASNCGP